jgi:hypothetical protein
VEARRKHRKSAKELGFAVGISAVTRRSGFSQCPSFY